MAQPELLQPVLLHRWKIDTTLSEDYNQLLVTQAVRCSIDVVNRVFKLEVEQPKGLAARMFGVIELLSKGATGITLQADSGYDSDAEDMVHITAEMTDHKYELDYAARSDVSLHKMEFKF